MSLGVESLGVLPLGTEPSSGAPPAVATDYAVIFTAGNGATGTQDFTSTGFGTPTAAVIVRSGVSDGSALAVHSDMSYGFWDGTNNVGQCLFAEDAQGSVSNTYRAYSTSHSIFTNTGTYSELGSVTSTVTDGIRVTWDVATDDELLIILIKGTVGATCGELTFNGDTSAEDVALGHEPHLNFFASIASNVSDTGADHLLSSFGIAHYDGTTTDQYCTGFTSQDGETSTVNEQMLRNNAAASLMFSGEVYYHTFSRPSADTLRMVPSAATSSSVVYLSLELADPTTVAIGDDLTPASTGTDAVTGVGFEPGMLLLLSTAMTTFNTLATDAKAQGFTIGASNGTAEGSIGFRSQDGASTTQENSHSRTNIIDILDSSSDSYDVTATLDSFDSDGFTLDYTATVSSLRYVWLATEAGTSSPTDLTADFVSSGSAVYEPTLQSVGGVDADFVASGSAVYEPTLAYVVTVDDDFSGGNVTSLTQTETATPTQPILQFQPELTETTGLANPRWSGWGAQLDGVDGLQPTFRITDADNHFNFWSERLFFSYALDGPYFETPAGTDEGAYHEYQHGSAFTQSPVYLWHSIPTTISQTASLAATVLASSYGHRLQSDLDYTTDTTHGVIATLTSNNTHWGKTIADQPLYGYRLSDDTRAPSDGKRVCVMIGHQHAGEFTGAHFLRKFIEWLLAASNGGSAGEQAAYDLLGDFEFIVYPQTNPTGAYGGHFRSGFEDDTGGDLTPTQDPNRDWGGTPVLASVQAIMDAIGTDVPSNRVNVFLDWHSKDTGDVEAYVSTSTGSNPDAQSLMTAANGYNAEYATTMVVISATDTSAQWVRPSTSPTSPITQNEVSAILEVAIDRGYTDTEAETLVEAFGRALDDRMGAGDYASVELVVDFVTSGSAIYEPSLVGPDVISADFLASGSAVYEPTLFGIGTLSADFLSSGSAVYEPSLESVGNVNADFLASGSAVYEPSLIDGGSTLVTDFVASGSVIYEPVLDPGPADLIIPLVASGSQIFLPALIDPDALWIEVPGVSTTWTEVP